MTYSTHFELQLYGGDDVVKNNKDNDRRQLSSSKGSFISHTKDSTCNGLYYTSRETPAGTGNESTRQDRSDDTPYYERTEK